MLKHHPMSILATSEFLLSLLASHNDVCSHSPSASTSGAFAQDRNTLSAAKATQSQQNTDSAMAFWSYFEGVNGVHESLVLAPSHLCTKVLWQVIKQSNIIRCLSRMHPDLDLAQPSANLPDVRLNLALNLAAACTKMAAGSSKTSMSNAACIMSSMRLDLHHIHMHVLVHCACTCKTSKDTRDLPVWKGKACKASNMS